MAVAGRKPKPLEQKKRLGNPGKRALPEPTTTLARAMSVPEPLRNLGTPGRDFWDRLWSGGLTWIAPQTDIELVQMLCEQIDERQLLRYRVMTEGDWRERNGLRQLDSQIMTGLSMLGFTPTDRARLGLAEVKYETKLDDYRKRKAKILDAEVVSEE